MRRLFRYHGFLYSTFVQHPPGHTERLVVILLLRLEPLTFHVSPMFFSRRFTFLFMEDAQIGSRLRFHLKNEKKNSEETSVKSFHSEEGNYEDT